MKNLLLTIIHAYQNPPDLRRCLQSFLLSGLRSGAVLVVDNSFGTSELAENRKIAQEFQPSLDITYADQTFWQETVKLLDSADREFLGSIHLGERTWSTHNARNVGMFLSRILFPDMLHSWNLDQDMVIPPDAAIKIDSKTILTCARISGCPDLSRLEWTGFYHLYLGQKYGVDTGRMISDYASRLVEKTHLQTVEDILSLYTEFSSPAMPNREKTVPTFIDREEFYGACYISRWNNTELMVPSWYDNDWFFFRQTRKNKNVVDFMPLTVHHASVKKNVLGKEGMEVEEYGKIVNEVYDLVRDTGDCTAQQFKGIISWRLKIIDTDLAANDILVPAVKTDAERKSLSDIKRHLLELKAWTCGISRERVLQDIEAYKKQLLLWRRAIENIDTNTGAIACRSTL